MGVDYRNHPFAPGLPRGQLACPALSVRPSGAESSVQARPRSLLLRGREREATEPCTLHPELTCTLHPNTTLNSEPCTDPAGPKGTCLQDPLHANGARHH